MSCQTRKEDFFSKKKTTFILFGIIHLLSINLLDFKDPCCVDEIHFEGK